MQSEWDENKNIQNRQKHGISFEEAQEIFDGIVFTSIDAIQGVVIVTVVHTERAGIIRIISARKAPPKERKKYYEYLSKTITRN